MNNKKTLEVDISATGILPSKLAEVAARVLNACERVEVEFINGLVTLRAVWEADADLAIHQIQEHLKTDITATSTRVVYIHEPNLLEPVMKLKIKVLEDYIGDVIAEINRRRGMLEVLEDVEEGLKLIECKVPLVELFGYMSVLRELSKSSGEIEVHFDSYQPAPHNPDPGEPWAGALPI